MDTDVPQVNTRLFAERTELDKLVLDLNSLKVEVERLHSVVHKFGDNAADLTQRFISQTKALRTRVTSLEKTRTEAQ